MDLQTEIADGVARITFNRPAARNAATGPMLQEMHRFLADVAPMPDVRCVLISGSGDHFMAGGDVRGFDEKLNLDGAEREIEFGRRARAGAALFMQLARMPQPVVVKVRGAAAGIALGFISASDFALCASSSVFVLAQVGIGASPDGATTWWLPRIVGARRAKEIALLGQRFGATEALQMGLVNQVLPDAGLDAAVDALIGRLVSAPAESVRRTKRLLDLSLQNDLESQLELEAQSFGACAATEDFVEGVRAFIGKRPAKFNQTTG